MPHLNVGSLVYEYQAIDVIGILDLLNSGSKALAKGLSVYAPISAKVTAEAPEINFHHIGTNLDAVTVIGGLKIAPTVTIDDAPEIDILVVGGPNLVDFTLKPEFAEYIRRHIAAGKLVFTNCTGAGVVAMTGALDGRNATINNVEYEWAKKQYPNVKWTKEKKWVVDGNIWTAAGAVTGMDMVAHWLQQTYGSDVMMLATMGLDFEPRDVNGVQSVIPKRYDSSGKQISTHVFTYYDSY
ncbi:DJ-1/PfpI family protein [Colletotrichum karsti]|uniref:DJ-1/PfpI family protein n=1 Tax=Colletotrichum karsti TaxID=1095194 RepID=A0A9P6I5K6_9PEZI|nr:DJ-1/PfpI family protein [Colletotrichum karsti]KAF9872410.1 DJ-1/PfpI family protein [Colletotrichum karsti]